MELKNHFKVQLKKVNGQPSIKEVEYIGADGEKHIGLEFEGYASTSELDRGGDITLPTAFKDSIKGFLENAMMLLQHNDDKPIGNFTEVRIDNNGLWVKGLVKVDIDQVFQKLRTGVLKTMSIGYRVLDYSIEQVSKGGEMVDVFIIKSLELFEISLVSVPMNAGAQIKSLKGLSDEEVKSLYNIEKEDIYTFSKSIEDLSNKVKNFNTNNLLMNKDNKEVLDEASENQVVENTETTEEKIVDHEVITEPTEVIDQPKEEVETETKSLEIETKENIANIKDLSIGDIVRFVKENDYDLWSSMEVAGGLDTAEVGEVLKIDGNMIWILKYELTMEGYKPTNRVCMEEFNDLSIMKLKPSQIKSLEEIKLKNIPKEDIEVETKDFEDAEKEKEIEKEEKQVEEEIKTEIKEEKEVENDEPKETPEKQAGDIAGEQKSVNVDLKFDTKQIENLTKEIASKLEKEFNEYKEITDKKVNDFIIEEKAKFDKSIEDFAGILTEALEVFKSTNEKAVEYISKIENSPIVKTGRYQEGTKKEENALTNLIKQIKR